MKKLIFLNSLPAGNPLLSLQITDLLQISRSEQDMRRRCRTVFRRLSGWRRARTGVKNKRSAIPYLIEGFMIKKQVRDAIFCYKMAKQKRIRTFQTYMENLPSVKSRAGGGQ